MDEKDNNFKKLNVEMERILNLLINDENKLNEEIKNMDPEQLKMFLEKINVLKEYANDIQNIGNKKIKEFYRFVDKETGQLAMRKTESDQLKKLYLSCIISEDYEICADIKTVIEERNETL